MSTDALISRLEAVAARLEQATAKLGGGAGGDDAKVHPAIADYTDYYNQNVEPFVQTCNGFDGLKYMAHDTETAFKFVSNVIEASTKAKKPGQKELMDYIKPIVDVVTKSQNCDNRSPFFNHQKAYAELIQLMNWILVPGPGAHVSGTLEAADFYLTKILSLAKDANDDDKARHRAFVAQSKNIINNLVPYINQYFKMGLNWNPKGVTLAEFISGASAPAAGNVPAAPPVTGGAPPPPPPPLLDASPVGTSAAAPAGKGAPGGMAAVFAELSKGEGITTGLKHVTKDMKTKNLKDAPVLEAKAPAGSEKKVAAPVVAEKKPPKLELRQGTWFVENYENEQLEIPEAQMKQNVYIFNCKNAVIQLREKVKSVQVDKCTKTSVVFASVVSTFEIVNSKSITIQVTESCPSLSIDKTAGCQIILNAASVNPPPNIITSSISEVNLVVPGPTEEADPIEMPLPEQYLTVFENGKITTTCIKHSG